MEDGIGPPGFEGPRALGRLRDIGHFGDGPNVEAFALLELAQFRIDQVQRVLRPLDQDESPRLLEDDLPAKLAADRPAGPGHHHAFSGDVAAHQVGVGSDLVAAQKLLDLDVAQIVDRDLPEGDLGNARKHPDPDVGSSDPKALDDLAPRRPARRGQGKEDLVDILERQDPLELIGVPDRFSLDRPIGQDWILVDEADDLDLGVAANGDRELLSVRPGAVDEDPLALLTRRPAIERLKKQRAEAQPAAGQGQQENQGMQHRERSREAGHA